jgi:hypothetical protein
VRSTVRRAGAEALVGAVSAGGGVGGVSEEAGVAVAATGTLEVETSAGAGLDASTKGNSGVGEVGVGAAVGAAVGREGAAGVTGDAVGVGLGAEATGSTTGPRVVADGLEAGRALAVEIAGASGA